MDEKLRALEALQKIDLSILDLTKSAETYPKRLAELEGELQKAKSAWDAEEARLADNERQQREIEEHLQDEKEKVKKWEARLTEQRTTREYSALAREIDIAKKSNITLSEESQVLLKAREELQLTAETMREAYEAKEAGVGKEAKELRTKIGELQGRIDELGAKRRESAKGVDPSLLSRYDAIRKRRGLALVPVRDGTCTGCRMRIPPQQHNQLRAGLPFDTCRSCNRLIYIEEAPANQG